MTKIHVYPESAPPNLDVFDNSRDRVNAMVTWFFENFGDPADHLPYEDAEGGYVGVNGPFDAEDELVSAFPDVPREDLATAVDFIQQDGRIEWSVSANRVVDLPEYTSEYDGASDRELPPTYDSHRDTIVETTLLPRRMFDWSVSTLR